MVRLESVASNRPSPLPYTCKMDISRRTASVAIMDVIEAFMRWWNRLARQNGKLKFKTQREAAEFVRRVHNENGGPNAKLVAMRMRYNEVNRARAARTSRSDEGRYTAVLG